MTLAFRPALGGEEGESPPHPTDAPDEINDEGVGESNDAGGEPTLSKRARRAAAHERKVEELKSRGSEAIWVHDKQERHEKARKAAKESKQQRKAFQAGLNPDFPCARALERKAIKASRAMKRAKRELKEQEQGVAEEAGGEDEAMEEPPVDEALNNGIEFDEEVAFGGYLLKYPEAKQAQLRRLHVEHHERIAAALKEG
jgi:hypothetical protein